MAFLSSELHRFLCIFLRKSRFTTYGAFWAFPSIPDLSGSSGSEPPIAQNPTVSSKSITLHESFGLEPLQKIAGDFCCIKFGGLVEVFFSGHFFPTRMRRKNPVIKSAKKAGGSKIKSPRK